MSFLTRSFQKLKKNILFSRLKENQSRPSCQRYGLSFLNGAQSLGVINDNAFKFLVVFLLIRLKGVEHSNNILFWIGIVYVVPFLLFSSAAGVLADRFSKQRIIISLKFAEVIIMALGIPTFFFKVEWLSYALLFLLSLQSALFSPSKYGIIPELVSSVTKIPKANGWITSFTYLGIILGTFLASFLTQISRFNFTFTACACTLIAILGFFSSLFIPYTKPKGAKRAIHSFFLKEIDRNLKYARKTPYLVSAILGSASFLFIGAYFQLNIIPYAIHTLHMSEVEGGYLFLLTAVGIALGALLSGRLLQKRLEIGLSCLSGILLSLSLMLLFFFTSLTPVLIVLLFVGFFGGLYIVPFDSYIQTYSPEERRGQIVAASSFLSFCGVLIAPILLYIFGDGLHLSAAQGFVITSILILLIVLTITLSFSSYFLSYLSRLFIKLLRIDLVEPILNRETPHVLVIKPGTKVPLYLIFAYHTRLNLYISTSKRGLGSLLLRQLSSVNLLYLEDVSSFLQALKGDISQEKIPCLLFPQKGFLEGLHKSQELHFKTVSVEVSTQTKRKSYFFFKKHAIFLKFSDN